MAVVVPVMAVVYGYDLCACAILHVACQGSGWPDTRLATLALAVKGLGVREFPVDSALKVLWAVRLRCDGTNGRIALLSFEWLRVSLC
jgi:hypothetical protein